MSLRVQIIREWRDLDQIHPHDTRQITRMRTRRNQYKQPNTHPEHVQLSQQPLMKNSLSHTQTVIQTHDLSVWSAGPTRGSEKQLVIKSTKPRLKKHTPTSQKELAGLDSSDLASSLWNYKKIQQHNLTTQQKCLTPSIITTSKLEGYYTVKYV